MLLGPSGEPISSKQFARPKKDAPLVGAITPSWQGIDQNVLNLPGGGLVEFDTSRLTLGDFRRMSEHPQIASSLHMLTFMIHQIDWQLIGGDEKVREHCAENLDHIWTQLIRSMSESFRFGFSANALQWENRPGSTKLWINQVKDLIPEQVDIRWKTIDGAPLENVDGTPMIGANGRRQRAQVPIFDGIRIMGDHTIPVKNCVDPSTLVLCDDLEWRRADEMTVGQKIVAFDEEQAGRRGRQYRTAEVEVIEKVVRDSVTIETDLGEPLTVSKKHPVLVRRFADKVGNQRDPETGRMVAADLGRPTRYTDVWEWVDAGDLEPGDSIGYLSGVWEKERSFEAGYVAAAFDGEGHITQNGTNGYQIVFTQRANAMLDRVLRVLRERGFELGVFPRKNDDTLTVTISGGRSELMRFFGTFDCVRIGSKVGLNALWENVRVLIGRNTSLATVRSVTEVGEIDLISLQTSTRTLITNGYLTHNSFWYPLLRKNGDMRGTKLLRTAFRSWYFHQLIMLFSNNYYERFGSPLPVGRAPYDDRVNIGTADKPQYMSGPQVMMNVVEAIRNRAAVVMPSSRTSLGLNDRPEQDYQLEYLESSLRGAEFTDYLNYLNEEMSMALFTPLLLMRTGNNGSYGQSTTHMQIWQLMLNALAADLKEYIDRYILARMAHENFGQNVEAPRISFRKMGKAQAETMRGIVIELLRGNLARVDIDELGDQIGLTLAEVEQLAGGDTKKDPGDPAADQLDALDDTPRPDKRIGRERRGKPLPRDGSEPSGVGKKVALRLVDQVGRGKAAPVFSWGHQRQLEEAFEAAGATDPIGSAIRVREVTMGCLADVAGHMSKEDLRGYIPRLVDNVVDETTRRG